MRTVIRLLVVILVAPVLARGQGIPGTNIVLNVKVISVTMRNDTTRIEYVLSNHRESSEQLYQFTVDAPSPVLALPVPEPAADWSTGTSYRGRSVAHWAVLGDELHPGQDSPVLAFEAVGLPGVVMDWVRGYVPPPALPDADTPSVVSPSDPLFQASVQGHTVGTQPFPEDRGVASLASRLQALTAQVCGDLGWLQNAIVCDSLFASLGRANEAIGRGDWMDARTQFLGFDSAVAEKHDSATGLLVDDNVYWLLKVNVEFILSHIPTGGVPTMLYLTGSGGTANPPTLSLSADAPTGTTAKYQDSPAINFNGGNPWSTVGTWSAAPTLSNGTLTALGDAHVWLGLKNSDDVGTNFDLRAEVSKNGVVVASGQTLCVQGLTRNANQAQEAVVSFDAFTGTAFDGTSDVLSLKVLTRVGTTETGASCGGHHNAVGLRLYFDATNRAAQLTTTF